MCVGGGCGVLFLPAGSLWKNIIRAGRIDFAAQV